MRRRSIIFRTDNGPAVLSVEVDPPLASDELFVDVGEPVVSAGRTRTMDEALIEALCKECR